MLKNISINNEPIMVKRALLSVYDKSNIVELANSLHENNVEIISSGGTASAVSYTHLTLPTKRIV